MRAALILSILCISNGDNLCPYGSESDPNYETLRIISNEDRDLELVREKISRYTGQAEARGMRYWVLLDGSDPVSVVTFGVEPVRLFAPIGTPLSLVRVIDIQATKETMRAVSTQAVKLSKENGAKYAYLGLPARHSEAVLQFKEAGFREIGDTYEMECPLDAVYEYSGALRFERVPRSELDRFMEYMKELLKGSPDVVLSMILDNIREMPDDFLDLWYGLEQLFLVYKGEEVVGMLDLSVQEGQISNIGVAPEQRNKGYGRQIMLYGMDFLKREGCNSAHLRVSVDNAAAIHLYESLGFTRKDRINHLIWWNR